VTRREFLRGGLALLAVGRAGGELVVDMRALRPQGGSLARIRGVRCWDRELSAREIYAYHLAFWQQMEGTILTGITAGHRPSEIRWLEPEELNHA
jgi:hypothetical protein